MVGATLYYDPDSIPEEHRKPYEMKGMLPGVPDLVEEGGMNRHLNNALREHEPNGGVLTAVEDFLRASHYELDLLELPGIHGLGILTPTPLKKQNPDLARLLGKLDFPPSVVRYVQEVERARLELQVRQQEEREEQRQRLAEEGRKLREDAAKAGGRKPQPQGRAAKTQRDAARVKPRKPGCAPATRWIETLDSGISALLRSRQWKVGSTAKELYRRATFKDEGVAVDEHLEDVLRKFRSWCRNGTEQDQGMKCEGDE